MSKLRVFVLNVGDGDSIVIEFPGPDRKYAVVDCRDFDKTQHVLNALGAQRLEFVCATHPHRDHISGIEDLLHAYPGNVREFWDSGFRHTSGTYADMVAAVEADAAIRFTRVTSGFERDINGVKVRVLAPSIYLRNRFDTLGVNMNNASVVLMLEYRAAGAARTSSIILGGDAQFDSWGKVLEEFPHLERTDDDERKVHIPHSYNPLNCQVLKVSHHGSKHGTALEYVERLSPSDAIVSCAQQSQYGFPHEIARLSLEDEVDSQRIYFTDYGSPGHPRSGTTIAVTTGRGRWTIDPRGEAANAMPVVPP